MDVDHAARGEAACEDIARRNHLVTERTIIGVRWLVVGFLFLSVNVLRRPEWPLALFNALMIFSALCNLFIDLALRKSVVGAGRSTLIFMVFDAAAVAVALRFTGGTTSPFLFLWQLILFAAGNRFGFWTSLWLLVPMAAYYGVLGMTATGADGQADRLIFGLFSLFAALLYGHVFSRKARGAERLLSSFHRESVTDRLTGLYNYAFFIDELRREQARAERTGSQFSLILFDLDFFKQVNDRYGHEKGNVLLKTVADIIRTSARSMDVVARYGGEEFVVLMPDSKGAELELAERIRKRIAETEFPGVTDHPVRITISAGACTFPKDARTADELLDKADKGLYEAKSRGRNQTCYCKDL